MAHPSVVINGVTYPTCPEVDIPISGGGTAKYYDATEEDITSADVRSGKKGIGPNGEVVGGLADNGATGGTISTKAGTVNIPAGITTGGSVSIAQAEQDKIIAANIKSGVTILGQAGGLTTPTITQNSTTKVLSIS